MNTKQFRILFISMMIVALFYASYESYNNLNYYQFEKEQNRENNDHSEGDHSEEINSAVQNAELDSNNLDLQLNAARILLQHDSLQASLTYYHRVEKLVKDDPNILAEIGMIKWNIKPSVDAMTYFTRSLAIDSTNAGALFGLGRASFQINEKERAIDFFNKIIKYHPNENAAKTAQEWVNALTKH